MSYIEPVNQIDIIRAGSLHSNEVSSLEDLVVNKYGELKMDTDATVFKITNMVDGQKSLSTEELANLQRMTSNYSLTVSLIGTLTRKTVTAVETLLKA
ncbi:type III secretion system inner rod subunit SctI (plasmid) [Escherichia coli]|uniref:type III secretion system inner rod subunit SctI n=1 Tax=Escherichia TaxID=561 RepID=UPI00056EEE7B|nr:MULTISPECIES: type III secretion system inner rod subunit SctI [Escherichia]AUT30066.1 protein mxiI [Escherichia marmotae]EFA4879630.1 protein mxiI [Escherichia coli]EFB2837573.1 protein mxiI [Escherichia coli]EFK5321765.1 protein mxiI [Escherichia coli]EGQ7459881.1 protein mxiI [Escherichia coli]